MNIVILHRIPYAKVCYERIFDHTIHNVTYICRQGGGMDLPKNFKKYVLPDTMFNPDVMAVQLGDLLSRCERLIARSEYDLIAAAELREYFDIQGDKPRNVLPMRDKLIMRQMCESAKIRQPRFWMPREFLADVPSMGHYLLKPRLEASSYGITTGIGSDIAATLVSMGEIDKYLVEDFVKGHILHVDGFMSFGELEAVVTSEYVGNCLAYASGTPLGSVQIPHDEFAITMAKRVLNALEHKSGSFHLEIIVDTEGHYHFLEVASRVGGAGVAETFEMKTGVNLYHADLHHQVFNERLRHESPSSPKFFGWFVYPGHGSGVRIPRNFDAQRWRSNLESYCLNRETKKVSGIISYAPDISPLSGILRGRAGELKGIIQQIFHETATVEYAS